MEGSVDEGSTKSDEEYDDLAMQDIPENGYLSDDEELAKKLESAMKSVDDLEKQPSKTTNEVQGKKYKQNLDLFLRNKDENLSDPRARSYPFLLKEKNERKGPSSGNARIRKRSLSIPAYGKHGSLEINPNLATALLR